MEERYFLVIGAGPVGLAVAKSLKMAHILYHQVEADDDVGGNWYHGTYKSTHVLSSRDVTEYPDFPMPKDYPDFPSSVQMFEYYQKYASYYNLIESIQFKTIVRSVIPIEDNLWRVKFDNKSEKTYKGVIVCNGHHWSKNFPKYDGMFIGKSFHSKEFKSIEQIKDKKVLVIGAGNSAFDIASECARVSAKTYLSFRRGVWIFPKTFMGKPLSSLQAPFLPEWLKEKLVKVLVRLTIGSYKEYGLPKPSHRVFDRHPTINTETLMHIKHGRITVKEGVKRLQELQVEFEDGSIEVIDTIVYATGFKTHFPFLPKKLSRVENNAVKVYGFSMYDYYKGIYIVGWMQPRGGIGSLIAPYADLLVEFIKLQDKIESPLGMVLREMGEPLPTSPLMGGPQLLKWITKISNQLNKIEKKGLKLDSKIDRLNNVTLEEKEDVVLEDTVVY